MDLFLPTQQTPVLVLFNIILLLLLYLTLKEATEPPHMVSLAKYRFALFLCVVFCIFSFWGADWFHYLEAFPMLQSGEKGHMEDVYVWIAQNLSPNYVIFRLIIWGGAFYLFIKILKDLNISIDLVLLFFAIFAIIWFSYARVTLAMCIAYWGGAIIFRTEKRFITLILGFVLICISTYFHKSAVFVVFIVFLAFLFNMNSKFAIRITILLFPIIVFYAKLIVSQFMLTDVEGADDIMSEYMAAGQNYMSAKSAVSGIGAIIARIMERTPYYVIAFIGFRTLISDMYDEIPSNLRSFIIIQILIVVFSSVFLFDLNANTSTLYGRFLRFDAIPTVVVMAYLYEIGIYRKLVNVSIYIAGLGTAYTLLYTLYDRFLNFHL